MTSRFSPHPFAKLTEQLKLGNIYIQTVHANKRWLHGRGIQLAARLFCRVFGHPWTRWRWEWGEEDATEMDFTGTPPPNVTLLWFRGCHRDCGTIQSCHARFDQKEGLPGWTHIS